MPSRKDQTQYERENLQVFQDLLLGNHPAHCLRTGTWQPAADVCETGEHVIVQVDLAGLGPGNLSLIVEGNCLVVRGIRPESARTKGARFSQMEISHGPFGRAFTFPWIIDPDGVRSTYTNGMLEVVVPKAQSQRTARVVIRVHT